MKKINNSKLDIILYFFTKVIAGIFSFVLVSFYTYYISPDLYGDYSLIIGLINVIIAVFIGWISSSCLRYYSKYKNDQVKFFSNILFDVFLMFIISCVILLGVASFSKNIPLSKYIFYVVLILIFNGLYDIFNSILRANKDSLFYFIVVCMQYLINLVLFIVLKKKFGLEIDAIFVALILANAFVVICSFIKFEVFKYFKFEAIDWKTQKTFLKYGIPMIGVWAVNWILNYSDRYMIKIFYSSAEVGMYDIAYKLTENSVNLIIMSLSMAMTPILVDQYNKGDLQSVKKIHNDFINLFFFLVMPCVLGIIGIRENLYGTLIDKSYILGVNVIIYVSISMLFSGYNQMLYKLFQLEEKTNKIFYLMLVSVIVNIILNIIFLPIYGFVVAAITTLIATCVATIIAQILVRKEFEIKLDMIFIIKTMIATAIMYGALTIVNCMSKGIIAIILSILVSIITYMIIACALGLIQKMKIIGDLKK